MQRSLWPRGEGADEVCGVVGAACAGPLCFLWVGAERSGSLGLAVGDAGRDNFLWRGSFFHPLLERLNHVEGRCAGAAAAVLHARHHEEAIELFRVTQAVITAPGHELRHTLVIADAVERGDVGIAPSVVLDQLAAARLE